MKKVNILTVLFLLSASLFAQSNKEDIDLIQSIFGKEKKELVQLYMTIPEAQASKFWALYDLYEDERKKLGRERIKLIEDYATNYEKLDKIGRASCRERVWIGEGVGGVINKL